MSNTNTLTSNSSSSSPERAETVRISDWKKIVAKYQTPSLPRALWQVANTLVPYFVLVYFMFQTITYSYWLTLALAIPAGALLVRVFIIFHDCGHGSFFKSNAANNIVGFICGILTLTPLYHWGREHSRHHASSGDLDRRGAGDIPTMTVQEYLDSSRWQRFTYKMVRNPVILFVLGPLYLFVFWQRFASPRATFRERLSVIWMNLALLGLVLVMSHFYGFKNYIMIQLAVTMISGTMGIWMFYVQHQFEGTYWERGEEWDYTAAALHGSSFYKLPKILQWFTGNIGYHHIHHLSPRIPNYHLQACHESHALFREVKPITLGSSLKSLTYRLWDEQERKLVGYRRMREVRRQRMAAAQQAAA